MTKRSNSLGYSRISFTTSGNDEIIVKIPADFDADVLILKIDNIGLVEFVDFGITPPASGEIVITDFGQRRTSKKQDSVWHNVMTNAKVSQATAIQDNLGNYMVAFTFTETGTKIFVDHTSRNMNTFLGKILDKVVITVPKIQPSISDGEGTISGNSIHEDAEEFAAVLNTSPLPFSIRKKE